MGLLAKKSRLFLSLGVVALAAQKDKVAKRSYLDSFQLRDIGLDWS